MTNGLRIVREDIDKIVVRGRCAFAFTGKMCYVEPLIEWYLAGALVDKYPASKDVDESTSMLVIDFGGHGRWYPSASAYSEPISTPFAVGNGCEYALGAMSAGKSALDAVVIACRHDAASGGKIRCINVADILNKVAGIPLALAMGMDRHSGRERKRGSVCRDGTKSD